MLKNDYKMILITDERQMLYFTSFLSSDGYVLICNDKINLIVDSRYYHACAKKLAKTDINVVLGSGFSFLEEKMLENDVKELGIDFSTTSVKIYNLLASKGYSLYDVSDYLRKKMSVKTDRELKLIKKSCSIAEKAFRETIPFIKEGVTEREIANILEFNFKKFGADGTSFDTIVAFGANSAIPHHQTGDTKLKQNQTVLMDFGCIYKGYCSDMTRTMFFGKPTKEFKTAYNLVLEAHLNAYNNIESGNNGIKADSYARDLLSQNGYGKFFTHSLGHGIGVNIHEYPSLSIKGENILVDNMVFSIEPGVYLNDKFGIRIEDSCYLENGKVKSFMTFTKKLIILK